MASWTVPSPRRPWPSSGLIGRRPTDREQAARTEWSLRNDHARAERLPDPERAGHADRQPVPALLDSGAALGGSTGAGLSAGAGQGAFRTAAGVSRYPGPRGRGRRVLRPPRGVALVRAQRGERVALLLSRLEVRRDRAVHRGAVRAGGERVLQEDQADVLSVRRTGRRHLDLYGAGRTQASSACFRMGKGAAFTSLRVEAHAGMQLSAGDGGRH